MAYPLLSAAVKPDGKTYTIRKGGKIIVQSSLPDCGYSKDELKSLRSAGFELYVDGKRAARKPKT